MKRNYLVVAILALAFLLRAPFFGIPLDYDEGTYAFFAFFSKGDKFYSSLPVGRLPGIIFTYRILDNLFPGQIAAFRIAAALLGVLGTFGIYQLGRQLLSERVGLFSALIFALFSSQIATESPANTEFFMVPLTVSAYWLFWLFLKSKRLVWLALSGLSAGLAIFYKQVAIFEVGFLGLWLVALGIEKVKKRKKAKRGLLKIIGKEMIFWGTVCLPSILALIYFFSRGEMANFWWQSFGSGGEYWHYAWQGKGWLARLAGTSRLLAVNFWPFGLLSFAGLLAVLAERKRKEVFLVCWLIATLVGAFFNGWFFPHYFVQIIPPVSLLGGFLAARFFERKWANAFWTLGALGIFFLMIKSQLPIYYTYWQMMRGKIVRVEYLKKIGSDVGEDSWLPFYESADWLRSKLKPEERLFVWGTTPLPYYLIRKQPTTAFVQNYPLLDYDFMLATARGWSFDFESNRSKLINEIEANPPTYIVFQVNPVQVFDQMMVFEDFSNFVSQNYGFEKKFGNLLIFKIKKESGIMTASLTSIPLELVKRFSVIVKVEVGEEQTEISFEPMVNPNGVLRELKAAYPEKIMINFETMTVNFLGQDGHDFVGNVAFKPSEAIDLHLKVKALAEPVSFVRLKMEDKTWNSQQYGVNSPIKIIQNEEFFDLYFEPPTAWQEKKFEVYFIFQDGTLAKNF